MLLMPWKMKKIPRSIALWSKFYAFGLDLPHMNTPINNIARWRSSSKRLTCNRRFPFFLYHSFSFRRRVALQKLMLLQIFSQHFFHFYIRQRWLCWKKRSKRSDKKTWRLRNMKQEWLQIKLNTLKNRWSFYLDWIMGGQKTIIHF